MGRNYKAPQGQFLDYIYQPNMELQLAVADNEVKLDSAKRAFASNTDYVNKPTFLGWQEGLDESVGQLNERIDPIVQKLVANPDDRQAYKEFKNITQEARDLYSSGDVGYMTRHYDTYQKELGNLDKIAAGIKDADERAMFLKDKDKWGVYINNQVKDYKGRYKEFGYNKFITPVDAQKMLDASIDPEKMKQEIERYTTGEMSTGEEKLFIQSIPGIDHQYYAENRSSEQYQQALIEAAAKMQLQNSEAYDAMLKQNFFTFGENLTTADPEKTMAEQYKDYKDAMIKNQANTFRSKFTGVKSKREYDILEDKLAMQKDIAGAKKAKENPLDLVVVDSAQDVILTDELVPAMEDWLNKLPTFNDPDIIKNKTPQEIQEFAKLNQAFAPLLEKYELKDLQDIASYLPIINTEGDSTGGYDKVYEKATENILEAIKGVEGLSGLKEEDVLKIFTRNKENPDERFSHPIFFDFKKAPYKIEGELPREVDHVSFEGPEIGVIETEQGKLIESVNSLNVHGETFEERGEKRALLARVAINEMQALRNAYNTFQELKKGSGELVESIQKNATINTPYLTIGAKTPLAKKTASLISSLRASGNQPVIYDPKTTTKNYKGEYRQEGALEGNADPWQTLQNNFLTTDIEELINDEKIHVKIAPLNTKDIEIVYTTGGPSNKDGSTSAVSTKMVYKNVDTNFWKDLAQHADTPEKRDIIKKGLDPNYSNVVDQVTKRVGTLKAGGTGLGPIKNTPLSTALNTSVVKGDVINGVQYYNIVWSEKDDVNMDFTAVMKNLPQGQLATYISDEANSFEAIKSKIKAQKPK